MTAPDGRAKAKRKLPSVDINRATTIAVSVATLLGLLTVGAWLENSAPQLTPFDSRRPNGSEVDSLHSELNAANRQIRSLNSSLERASETISDLRSEIATREARDSGSASGEDVPGQAPSQGAAGHMVAYEDEPLTLNPSGCGGPTWLDLDEPRVAFSTNTDTTTEVVYNTCGRPPQFEGHDIPIAEVEASSAEECVSALRKEPLDEITDLEEGQIFCVITERDRIAAVEVTNIDDHVTEVVATAWESDH